MLRTIILSAVAAAGLGALSAPAGAATAHNSQAGSWGPTSHTCAPTPYFQTGGCASAAIVDEDRYPLTLGPEEPYPARHRLTYPGGPLPRPAYPDE